VKQNRILASGAALVVAAALPAPALAGGRPPRVTIRIEGRTRTLLAATAVRAAATAVRRGRHWCRASSALGALDRAVGGRWSGSWLPGRGFAPTTILGETASYNRTHGHFEVFTDHVMTSAGLCTIRLRGGEQILLADVPGDSAEFPLVLRAVSHAFARRSVTVTVFGYDARGDAHRLAGATVRLGSSRVTTGPGGTALLWPAKAGTYTLRASKPGYVRDEAKLAVRL
jgi:hypothetical protein